MNDDWFSLRHLCMWQLYSLAIIFIKTLRDSNTVFASCMQLWTWHQNCHMTFTRLTIELMTTLSVFPFGEVTLVTFSINITHRLLSSCHEMSQLHCVLCVMRSFGQHRQWVSIQSRSVGRAITNGVNSIRVLSPPLWRTPQPSRRGGGVAGVCSTFWGC